MKILWTEKYRPLKVSGIIGQAKAVSEALPFVDSFSPGKALLLSGPSGTGKSLLVETLAGERNFLLLRLNASDSRSAEDIISFFEGASRTKPIFHRGKIILIDEVDGISGNDRGAVAAIIRIIKESLYPVFLIANSPWSAKLRPLRPYVKAVKFSKIRADSMERRLREISEAEGISHKGSVLKNLARWSQGDLRSAISDLQTVAEGKREISDPDLEILGYRERELSIFDILPTLFKSRSLNASRKAMQDSDKDSDEIFWWVENNIPMEFPPEKLAQAYDLLSRADIIRSRVMKQQNWRLKAVMSDMVAGISVVKGEAHAPRHGFMMYQPPQKLMMMGRTKGKRAETLALCKKIGSVAHASTRVVKRDYLPYLKMILREREPEKTKSDFSVNFTKDEAELITG